MLILAWHQAEVNLIAITDDDWIPRPDWLFRIERWLIENKSWEVLAAATLCMEMEYRSMAMYVWWA